MVRWPGGARRAGIAWFTPQLAFFYYMKRWPEAGEEKYSPTSCRSESSNISLVAEKNLINPNWYGTVMPDFQEARNLHIIFWVPQIF